MLRRYRYRFGSFGTIRRGDFYDKGLCAGAIIFWRDARPETVMRCLHPGLKAGNWYAVPLSPVPLSPRYLPVIFSVNICGMRLECATVALTCWVCCFMFAAVGVAEEATVSQQSKAPPIPQDSVADSYEIYSELLPGREIEWGDAPRSFWLVEEQTKAEPLDSSCKTGGMMNPHRAIQVPLSSQASFAEVLADFDQRCHERYQLDVSQFHLKLPIRLLDEKGQKRYADRVSGYVPPRENIMQAPPMPEEFKGAAGVHRFTAVYFNHAHTLAMTEIGMYCGRLCGNWRWVVLERKNGRWQSLPWVVSFAVS
jgi:hypothetical protein